jgi:Mrp family chromosome partitioning ATPase
MTGQSEQDQTNRAREMEQRVRTQLDRIHHKLLVLSNKGGVGKSSVAASLALWLSRKAKTGLLDADITGPSLAKMLGVEQQRLAATEQGLQPLAVTDDLSLISMASLLESAARPVIWRGPIKGLVIRQFLGEANWGDLEYLIIDAPPGTGDEPLTICQTIPELDGAIVVTTPQEIALLDVRKCVNFLRALGTRVLGIVENMSGLECPHCHEQIDLFGTGGGERAAREMGVPFLGRIPFDPEFVTATDEGRDYLRHHPKTETGKGIRLVAEAIETALQDRERTGP